MATGTGLDAQLGIVAETTVGTAVTVTRFLEFNSESLAHESIWSEPSGLRVGRKFKREGRLRRTGVGALGSFSLNHATRGMGLLWKYALGSTATAAQITTTTAYKQVHQPAGFVGKSLTIQVGRPEPDGTVQPFTYRGCKVTGWEFSVSDGEVATMSFDVDGWNEATDTALATASFTAAEEFGFEQATVFKLGGTASTTSSVVSVATGVQVTAVINGITISGSTPMKTDRRGLGNAGVKKEQLENDIPTITGTLDAEFDKAELYDLYTNQTAVALQLSLIGSAIGVSGENDTLDIILPAVRFKGAAPAVDGPDVVSASIDFEVYDDEVNAPIQVTIISADTAI